MEYENPSYTDFTIYSKSGCPNCSVVKKLLQSKNLPFNVVNCDDYIIKNKDLFFFFIKCLSDREFKQFPIIFHKGTIIGGCNESKEYINRIFLSFDDDLDF